MTHCRLILLLVVALIPGLSRAEVGAPDVDAVADAYLGAIQAQDWDAMATFLTDTSSYQDFTAAYFGQGAVDLVGSEAIAGFWRDSAEASGTTEIRYEVVKRFVAGPCVVIDFVVHVRARAASWRIAGGGDVEFSATLVTFLRVEDDKIVHHQDHVDYAAWDAATERLRAARGTLERGGETTDDGPG